MLNLLGRDIILFIIFICNPNFTRFLLPYFSLTSNFSARILVSSSKIDINLKETTFDATPLILACKMDVVTGGIARRAIIELLLKTPR
jgi:hypothetical protein